MNEPITDISTIVRDARQCAEAGEPVAACPYPSDWEAANRWRIAYYAREMELLGEAA